ncbi:hypothetical protein ACFL35_18155 [Candidatus Riflebacteria bacterium]
MDTEKKEDNKKPGCLHRTAKTILTLFFVFIFIPFFYLSVGAMSRKIISRKNATRVALALENFKKEKNIYPRELEELVPKYLKEVPDGIIAYGCEDGTEYHFMFCTDGLLLFPWEDYYSRRFIKEEMKEIFEQDKKK